MTEKSEQEKLLEKASAKNEQEIIEEIIKETKKESWRVSATAQYNDNDLRVAISKSLQKGKELRDYELENAVINPAIEKLTSKIAELEKKLIEYQKRNRELGNKLFEIPGLECDCDGSGSEDGHELMCPFKPFQSVIDELRGEK